MQSDPTKYLNWLSLLSENPRIYGKWIWWLPIRVLV